MNDLPGPGLLIVIVSLLSLIIQFTHVTMFIYRMFTLLYCLSCVRINDDEHIKHVTSISSQRREYKLRRSMPRLSRLCVKGAITSKIKHAIKHKKSCKTCTTVAALISILF